MKPPPSGIGLDGGDCLKEERRQTLAVAGTIVGSLIGAGFASGQEVLQFFTAYGPAKGTMGAGLMLLVLVPMTAAVPLRGNFSACCGARLGGMLQGLMPVICFGVYAVMLSGAGALLQQAVGLPPFWGRTAMLCLTLWSVLAGLDRLTRVLGLAGPVIVVFVLVTAGAALLRAPVPRAPLPADLPRAGAVWWISALTYGGYNGLLLAPFLMALGGQLAPGAAGRRQARRAALLGCGGFGLAVMLLHLALCAYPGATLHQAPAVALAVSLWPGAAGLTAPVLAAGVYTTAVPLLWSACAAPRGKACSPARRVGIALAGWGCSALPFSRLVGALYPLIGWLGLMLAAGILVSARGRD